MSQMMKERRVTTVVEGQCPSCGVVGAFKFIGTQVWPEDVAIRLGVDLTVALYLCENCLTTVSEPMLLEADDD
jgi:hypothetical protein